MLTKRIDSLRVFIGTSADDSDAEACVVCEHSVRTRASIPVDVTLLRPSTDPTDPCCGWRKEEWQTPWTALRWAIPTLCGWRGRAVYFDCPTLVLGDVVELAQAPTGGACVLARREGAALRTGCLVFDCDAARGKLPDLGTLRADVGAHQAVGALLASHPKLLGQLPAGWGLRDADYSRDPDVARSVHFAAPELQPHLPHVDRRLRGQRRSHWFAGARLPHYSKRLVAVWETEYAAALAAGFHSERYVSGEGGVRGTKVRG